jgi:hypothetical protein
MSDESSFDASVLRGVIVPVICLLLGISCGLLLNLRESREVPTEKIRSPAQLYGLPSAEEPQGAITPLIATASYRALIDNQHPISDPSILLLSGRRERFIAYLQSEARRRDLPADLADAVAYVESGYNPEAIGLVGEVGLMQVRPETAAMLGFKGDRTVLEAPETNIRYGVEYLAGAWRLSGGDVCRALMKYRAGHGEERMTQKSVDYCDRAKAYLRRIHSPIIAGISTSPLEIAGAKQVKSSARQIRYHTSHGLLRPRRALYATSSQFWAAHEANIRLLRQRAYAKWRTLARSKSAAREHGAHL